MSLFTVSVISVLIVLGLPLELLVHKIIELLFLLVLYLHFSVSELPLHIYYNDDKLGYNKLIHALAVCSCSMCLWNIQD
jgi:hypothetical protein